MTAIETAPSGSTRFAAVIGHPIEHSLSPLLMHTAFSDLGIDWMFGAFDVDTNGARGALGAMRHLGIAGYSVTMPLKSEIITGLDDVSDVAAKLGAVNCVSNVSGRLIGYSTDGDGLVDTLTRDEHFDPSGATCVVLGAGGAARSAVLALAAVGASEVIVVNRTESNGAIAAALAGARGRVGGRADLARADLIVNATPVGMGAGSPVAFPLDVDVLHDGQFVFDMVYHPIETNLVRAARERGASSAGGLGMLVHQAARAITIWTGLQAPIDAMTRAVQAALARRKG